MKLELTTYRGGTDYNNNAARAVALHYHRTTGTDSLLQAPAACRSVTVKDFIHYGFTFKKNTITVVSDTLLVAASLHKPTF
jgi:hypothetical protein